MAIARLRQPNVSVSPEIRIADTATPACPHTAASDVAVELYRGWIIAAGVCVVIAAIVAYLINGKLDAAFTVPTPPSGLNAFALFYVAAQVIERLLEPLSAILLPTKDVTKDRDKALAAYISAPPDHPRTLQLITP
jgi:hypothetical protein